MAKRGMLFVVSGPAGAGKSEIVKTLLKKHDDVKLSVSCTTRNMRPGEVDGVAYYFLTNEEFDRKVEQGDFYEWAWVHTNRYGTPKDKVAETLDQGIDMILEIDVQGFENVKKIEKDAVGVFVSPPSAANLAKRLIARGTESEESLRVRLGRVAGEVREAYKYDHVIIHRDWAEVPNALELAADELYGIITSKRNAIDERREFLDSLTEELTK